MFIKIYILDEWVSSDWKHRENKYWKNWKYINKWFIKLYKSKFEKLKKWENTLDRETHEWDEWIEIKDYFFMNKKSNEWAKFENDTTQDYEEWRNEFIDKLIKEKKWNVWKHEKENYKPQKRKLKEKEKKTNEQKSDLNNSSSKKPNSPNTESNAFNFVSNFFKQWNTPIFNFKPEYGSRNNFNTTNRYFMEFNRNENNWNTHNNDCNLLNKACNFWKNINGFTASLNDNWNHRDFRNTDLNTSNRWNSKWNNRNELPKSSYGIRKRLNAQNIDYNPMVDILKYMDTQSNDYNLPNINWNH